MMIKRASCNVHKNQRFNIKFPYLQVCTKITKNQKTSAESELDSSIFLLLVLPLQENVFPSSTLAFSDLITSYSTYNNLF